MDLLGKTKLWLRMWMRDKLRGLVKETEETEETWESDITDITMYTAESASSRKLD